MANELRYARTQEGQTVDAEVAQREDVYFCVQCGERVWLKRGDVRRAHFAHGSGRGCGGEQVIHLMAKEQVRRQLDAHGGAWLIRVCASVGCDAELREWWELPSYSAVESEVPCGGFRLDVGVTLHDQVVAGVEIYYGSRVSRFKRSLLEIPWFEVSALQVLDSPDAWEVLHTRLGQPAKVESLRQQMQRMRHSRSLSDLRRNAKFRRLAGDYVRERYGLLAERLAPDAPWVCEQCLEDARDLGELVIESEEVLSAGQPSCSAASDGEPLRSRREFQARASSTWLHDFLRELAQDVVSEDTEPLLVDRAPGPQVLITSRPCVSDPAEQARREALQRTEREAQLAAQGERLGEGWTEVLVRDDLAFFEARSQEVELAFSQYAQVVTDASAVEQNCFVVGRCACGHTALLVWTKDEVFHSASLPLLRPRQGGALRQRRGLPPRDYWLNVCAACGQDVEVPAVHWRFLLPGRVLLRLLIARGLVGSHVWGGRLVW